MSKQRSQKTRLDSAVSEEYSVITQISEGTDPDTLPFPEWSDQEVNGEKWDAITIAKDKILGGSKLNVLQLSVPNFEDSQEVHVPPSLGVQQWKRCCEIFPDANFSIFINKSTYPDLVTPNHHLLKSEFYRSFISSIETLLYIGSTKLFPEEYGSASGYSAQADRSWRPWHHIYSNCKIVKNVDHTPMYNPFGKYVVRLYWMGSWRKIYVDDFVPLDKTNRILLPSLYIPSTRSLFDGLEVKPSKLKEKAKGIKKETIELWPLILCKALLKIGALSWSNQNELNDFDIINCLTGWIPQRIKTKDISTSDLWDVFMAYVEHFEWEGATEEGIKKGGSPKSKAKGAEKQEVPKKTLAKGAIPSGIENIQDGDRYMLISCDSSEYAILNSESVKLSHHHNRNVLVFISQVRDIPLVKPPPRPELELWQKFRYEEWAVERGIIPPDIPKLNIKSLKIIDPFTRKSREAQEPDSYESKTQTSVDTEATDKKSEKSSKSSKKPKEKGAKNRLEPDPAIWVDFDEIKSHVNHIQIYFQPRGFKTKAKISDINFQYKTTDFKHILAPLDLKVRNEPTYLLLDSIDSIFLVINLMQIGNLLQLEKHAEIDIESLTPTTCTDERDICREIVFKKTIQKKDIDLSLSQISNKSTLLCSFDTKSINAVLEEYFWDSNAFGKPMGMLHTYGNKSIILDLKPGRKSFRLWVSPHCSYVLQVFSDTPMTVGYLEEFITACTAESKHLTNLSYQLASCFGKLVQSLGTSEYSSCLKNFYQCYKPTANLTNSERVTIHNAFFEEFSKLIISQCSSQSAFEFVRLLFLQLKTFDYINPYTEVPHLNPQYFFNMCEVEYAKKMQKAAVKVQAFFKGVYIRLLMKKLNEDHRQFNGIFDTLKRIYNEIFSADKRLNNCPRLFRNLFERQDMEKLKEKFEIYREIRSVVNVHVFTDSLIVNESGWVPVCRYVIYVNCVDPIPVKISLFCSLKNYYIRVFNNDTEKELKRYTNNVAVETYENNIYGYTVLGYGWAEENTKLNWKLVLTEKKMSRADLVIIAAMPIINTRLKDCYMPNFDNTICRYIIKVASDSCLTAHLRTSYDQVELSLKLMNEDGKILRIAKGTGTVLLPVLNLHNVDKSRQGSKGPQKRKRSSAQSRLSEITYSKLNKKPGSSESMRSGSQKKVVVDTDAQEIGGKRQRSTKKKGAADTVDDGDNISQTSERSRDSSGKTNHRKSKGRTSESSDGDSINKKSFVKSRSFEKLNKGPVVDGKSRGSGTVRQPTLNKVLEADQTKYILEGTVLKDSWPLTAEEWQRNQQLREKSYLNILGRGERKSITAKKSLMNRRMEEPYFVLDLVYSHEDSLDFEQDYSKSEKRKDIKKKWFKDPDRYQKGAELRNAFLEENLIYNENCMSKDIIRSNDPRQFALKIVNEPSLEEFMIKPLEIVDEDECTTKLSEDYCIDETYTEKALREYKGNERAALEDNEELLQKQIYDFYLLLEWFTEIRNDSTELLMRAWKMEKDYVKKFSEQAAKARKDKAGKEIKKKK